MAAKKKVRGVKVDRKCECCQKIFSARQADVDRGWARFCTKKCKAINQEGRTHQYRDLLRDEGGFGGLSGAESEFDEDMMGATTTHGQDPQDSWF